MAAFPDMHHPEPIRKTVLITGASAGIGESFARYLAAQGWHTLLAARSEDRLQKLAREINASGGRADVLPGDISQHEDRECLIEKVNDITGGLDILINNAGFGWYGYFHQMPWKVAEQMAAVNILAVVHLTRLVLPGMLARGGGHIINIGSVAGGFPNQGVALYSASKAFMDAFTTSLHRELRGSGVHASVMRLGPVQTEFFSRARKLENGGTVPAEKLAIPVERINKALGRLIQRPRRVVYVPWFLGASKAVELLFGGVVDQLGPLLLRRDDRKTSK